MADAVVSFAVERLGDLLISESKLLYGVTNQVNEVRDDLKRMQNFLKEADKRQIQDERVRGWVNEIQELAFRTEDVIELFALQATTNSGFKEALRRSACITCHLISRHNVAMEINSIKAKLADIRQSLPTFGITGLEQGETSIPQRTFYSHDVEKDFVGMEKEIDQLVSDLMKKDENFEVVSLWGMGGQGKTTLAQKLYNHVKIRDHFEAFAWVCISQQFDREKVLKGILKQLLPDDRKGEVSNMEDPDLVDGLRKVQLEKKCLIVNIDDIWNVDSWRKLQAAFPLGETTSGCKILLTTRNLTVAEIGSVCKIPGLTEDEGWQLLSRKTRIYDQPELPVASGMERIGRNMVKGCKGLPLAISALGGILKGKHLLTEWEKINNDITFYLGKGEGVTEDDEYCTVRQVLGLSYDNLPSRLRHCFLCFANYKEDEIIQTEDLYMFWMAEGLISVEDRAQGEMMLDVAERYLDELAHRSLVTVRLREYANDSWSKYEECVVHDLIQDLCWSKVKEQGVMNVIDLERKLDIGSKAGVVRRLCVRSYNANRDVLEPYDGQVLAQIRSLFFWNDQNYHDPPVWPNNIFTLDKFKLLRVFTAKYCKLSKENVRSLSELVYLKHLSLYYCELDILPSSIAKLRNLETLELGMLATLSLSIPNVLWKLKLLNHLCLPDNMSVRGRAKKLRLGGLNELQLLYGFDSNYCDAHDLLRLPKLKAFKGQMIVKENLTTQTIIDFAKFRELRHTDISITETGTEVDLVLVLECCFIDSLYIYASACVFPKACDCTCFSGRLTKLTLNELIFEENPMILLGKIPNLRFLSLQSVKNTHMDGDIVCSAMSFPKLEVLRLIKFKGLRKWRLEEGAMPNLTLLIISKCLELDMLPEGLKHLTSLKQLSISGMQREFTDKVKVIDGVEGQDFYKIRHIPLVIIK
ncbi:probable disease resistance protein RF45 [Daucus carota subsp. sativus]